MYSSGLNFQTTIEFVGYQCINYDDGVTCMSYTVDISTIRHMHGERVRFVSCLSLETC